MQCTKSASMIFLRISPSLDWLDDMDPLARTNPATPRGGQVVQEVLDPSEVGISDRKYPVGPPLVLSELASLPFFHVERGIGQDQSPLSGLGGGRS